MNNKSEGNVAHNTTERLLSSTTRFYYKNNFIRTRCKFAQKLKTSKEQLRLDFRCKCKVLQIFIEKRDTSRHFGVSILMQVFLQLETLCEQRRSECRSVYTAIINLCCRNKINFITMFSNKTPQIAVNLG